MRRILHFLGPDSPMGPLAAGVAALACLAVVLPPVIWLLHIVFGWWWGIWL